MSISLVSKIKLSLNLRQQNPLDLVTADAPLLKDYAVSLLSGTGAGRADKIFSDTRTISSGEDLDLAGVLLDIYGTAITFARVKALIIHAKSDNVGNVLVGGVANGWATLISPAATGIVTLRPDTTFAVFAGVDDATGYAVTAATGDLLHVAPSTGTVTYDVIAVGASA